MTQLTSINYSDIPPETLAELANDAAGQAEKTARKSIEYAITAGAALVAAKAQIPHGEWLAWLKTNWDYSERHAQSFMRISTANANSSSLLDGVDSIKGALECIAEYHAEPEAVATTDREATEAEKPVAQGKPEVIRNDTGFDLEAQHEAVQKYVRKQFQKCPEEFHGQLKDTFIEMINEVTCG